MSTQHVMQCPICALSGQAPVDRQESMSLVQAHLSYIYRIKPFEGPNHSTCGLRIKRRSLSNRSVVNISLVIEQIYTSTELWTTNDLDNLVCFARPSTSIALGRSNLTIHRIPVVSVRSMTRHPISPNKGV